VTKAYSYIRMSTDTQLKGDSLRRQVEKSTRFAQENGLVLDTAFNLKDIGFSAFDGSNVEKGQLGKFLAAVKMGKIENGSFLIVESLDRLTRQRVRPALRIFLDLLDHGITIATLIDKRIFRPEDVDHGDLMYSLGALTRAHDESVTKSERVAEAWKEKRNRISTEILTSRCVAWLKAKQDRRGFDLVKDRVEIVRRIFSEASEKGMGADMIARRLNREGVPTFGRSHGWHKSYILKILTNRAVLGEFRPSTVGAFSSRTMCEAVEKYYPPIIDETIFYKAQAAMASRKQAGAGRKGERVSNLFTRLLTCGVCCGPMQYLNKGKKGGQILICDNANRGLGCHRVSWRYEEFEQTFLTFVSQLDVTEFFDDNKIDAALKTARDKLNEIEGTLQVATEQRERVFKLLMGDEPTEFLQSKLRSLDEKVESLTRALSEATAHRLAVLQEHRARADSKSDILTLIRKVQSERTDDVVVTRSTIAARLQSLIKEVLVFPGGRMLTAEEEEIVVDQLADSVPSADVRKLAHFPIKAQRAFYVDFKDGTYTIVNPFEHDPGKANYVVTDREASSREEGSAAPSGFQNNPSKAAEHQEIDAALQRAPDGLRHH
jgi:DNA invertase Pin-like site-specific DNA recombinase